MKSFFTDLKQQGNDDRVTVMTFSEFGRRVAENASAGTDHGKGSCLFVAGKPVKGGLYGKYPSLTDLSQGDLKFTTDFRGVYATVIEDWLKAKSEPVLRGKYEKLGFMGGEVGNSISPNSNEFGYVRVPAMQAGVPPDLQDDAHRVLELGELGGVGGVEVVVVAGGAGVVDQGGGVADDRDDRAVLAGEEFAVGEAGAVVEPAAAGEGAAGLAGVRVGEGHGFVERDLGRRAVAFPFDPGIDHAVVAEHGGGVFRAEFGLGLDAEQQRGDMDVAGIGVGDEDRFVDLAMAGDEDVLDRVLEHVDGGRDADRALVFVELDRADTEAAIAQFLDGGGGAFVGRDRGLGVAGPARVRPGMRKEWTAG